MIQSEPEIDWEYEYDAGETEDFYFTLDVSTYQPEPALKASQPSRKTPKSTSKGSQQSRLTRGKPLQVLALDSTNPWIMLDGQLYSCQWSTDLGSQFYVAGPGAVERPLRPGHALDVVGLSRARLVGRPAALRERINASEKQAVGASAADAIEIVDEAGGHEREPSKAPSQDSQDIGDGMLPSSRTLEVTDPALQARASFLERLQSSKRSKGETDRVPLFGVKNYQTPTNKEEIRQQALEADREQDTDRLQPNGGYQKRGPYKRKSSTVGSNAVEKKRKKPGPKSNASVRASLGFAASNNTGAAPRRGGAVRTLRSATDDITIADEETEGDRPHTHVNSVAQRSQTQQDYSTVVDSARHPHPSSKLPSKAGLDQT